MTLKNIRILTTASLAWLIILSPLCAQTTDQATDTVSATAAIDAQTRAQVFQLLSMDCGVDTGANDFQAGIAKMQMNISPLLVQVVREGMPDDMRKTVADKTERDYQRRQTWLKTNGASLFDEQTVQRLLAESPEQYRERKLKQLNLRFRENSIRGLQKIGNADSIDVISEAAVSNPDLSVIAASAITSIQAKNQLNEASEALTE